MKIKVKKFEEMLTNCFQANNSDFYMNVEKDKEVK
jgi:hypothetical protein